MNAQQQDDELRQRTEQALQEAKPFISAASYQLLCWHCGVRPQFFQLQRETQHEHHYS